MNERWICPRCYTSAEPNATVCPNCGTARETALAAATAAGELEASPDTGSSTAADPAPALDPAPPVAADPGPGTDNPVDPSERWVCRRCFVSNDGSAAVCANCALLRGAEPPADDPGAWVAASEAPPPTGRRFPWQWVIFGVIALAVVGGSILFAARRDDGGEITGAGSLDVQDIRVGDCFDLEGDVPDSGGEVSSVRAIPCEEPHVYEMFFVGDYPEGEEPSGPNEEYTTWEQDACVGSFESYVGHSFDTSIYFISALTPTDESWAQGDRSLQCFLHNEAETAISGSAEGSGE